MRKAMVLAAILALCAICGCGGNDGTVRVVLTDQAPYPGLDSLKVAITKAEVTLVAREEDVPGQDGTLGGQQEEDTKTDASVQTDKETDTEKGTDATGWRPVLDTARDVNVASLHSGVTTLLGEESCERGYVTQVRLFVEKIDAVRNGKTIAVDCASWCGANGVTTALNGGLTVTEGLASEVVVSFDTGVSLRDNGSGGLIMDPVLKVVSQIQK